MRSEHDIRSMMDYLAARDPNHPDLSAFRWVLGENAKSEWELKFEELARVSFEAEKQADHLEARLRETIATQDAEIRRLKSEPDHK